MLAAVLDDAACPRPPSLVETVKEYWSGGWGMKDWGINYKLRTFDATIVPDERVPEKLVTGHGDEGVDPEKEGRPDDLVLESWAHCVSKSKYAKSQEDYVARAQGVIQASQRHLWRKRSLWINMDCGEDSFFVANTRQAIGIADGVGGWRATNINPADISNALMENGKKISEAERSNLDPLDLMTKSWDAVKKENKVRGGSTTALFATIESGDNEGKKDGGAKGILHLANLGDSGLLLWRKNHVRYRAKELQHRFNAPYQLAIIPEARKKKMQAISDPPSKSFVESIPVQEDDIVVLGTDGLFDNMHNSEIAKHCDLTLNTTGDYGDWLTPWTKWKRNAKNRMYPKDVVPAMVEACMLNAKSKSYVSPFSYALMEHGVAEAEEARGGKPDDITVVLARVVRRKNWRDVKGRGGGEGGSPADRGTNFYGYMNKPNLHMGPRGPGQ
eukprot:TRINITY_DN11271_c0_g1_i1.p1 TRINITY_DN11271_c0_g1~~TRINITY_DN11271_c0_g1_i1.p1  ORF type:complete len:444 (+),score=165.90 TRINITY_DN11271_c0_g1_i1:48-1379(+)